jgi:NADPH-dependent glutamate synthase beta subunit-like oxidoreductase
LKIKLQQAPRAIWHADCEKTASGIMQVESHEADYSLARCLDCGGMAKIPVGTDFGVYFEAASA